MPTKKSIKHHAGAVARAKRAVKKAERKLSYSQLEAQIALLEEQIALLKGEGAGDFPKGIGKFSQGDREKGSIAGRTGTPGSKAAGSGNREDVKTETLSPNPYPLFPPLPAPVLAVLTAMGDSVFVRWSEVAGATDYEISLAYDANFTKPAGMMGVDASRTWATLPEMYPDTTFFIRVKAFGDATHADSAYSNVRSIRTFPEGMTGTSDESAMHLQNWLENLQNLTAGVAAVLPQIENTELNTADRMRLRGSGVRRYGFIEKVFEVSADYPQFWPPFGDGREEMSEYVKEIDALRNLLIWARWLARVVQDLLLIAGNDAFRVAGAYYTLAREGSRKKNPDAVQVYDMLRLFWKRPRKTSGEPTIPQVLRDTRDLLHGTKDGNVSVQHESPTTSGGVHEVIDNVHSAKCRVQSSKCKVKEDE